MNEIENEVNMACTKFWYRNLVKMRPPVTTSYLAEAKVLLPEEGSGVSKFLFPYMISSDPEDKITIQFEGEDPMTFRMHSASWLWSLDYLLYRYLTLALRETDGRTKKLGVPSGIQDKYTDYLAGSKPRRKNLSVRTPEYLEKPSRAKNLNKMDGYIFFNVPLFLEPYNLNCYCQELFTRPNNKSWLSSPRRDGIIFQSNQISAMPAFELEDYVAHELWTGISLSTEITAVVLELDKAIRDIALKEFCEHALGDIVRLPFPFARIAAARNFFQQISSEWAREKYNWSTESIKGHEAEILAGSFRRARMHVDFLMYAPLHPAESEPFLKAIRCQEELQEVIQAEESRKEDPTIPRKYKIIRDPKSGEIVHVYEYPQPYLLEFPNTKDPVQMDSYMNTIKAYLQVVTFPLDWKAITKERPKHLAIFTNQKHNYVPLLLNYLEKGQKLKHFENNILPMKGADCIELYHTIHGKVRKVSNQTYKDLRRITQYLDRD